MQTERFGRSGGTLVLALAGAVSLLGAAAVPAQDATDAPFTIDPAWQVVVNNSVRVPGDARKFNSYNQPSVNVDRQVVFRARSKGGTSGEPAHGIFMRDMALGTDLITLFDRTTAVPAPDNLGATFIEPPSFPRIDIWSTAIASRANHQPVWRYLLPGGTETRAGTTGIFTYSFSGGLLTGASNLGSVPDYSFLAVPGAPGVKFDVFPGAPSVTDGSTIVFKGNYTVDGVGRTGVYYRDLTNAPVGGSAAVMPIAGNETPIPGTTMMFGSTAPPSAAGRQAVFAGFDNEDAPTLGGIYLAALSGSFPRLRALVSIGGQVPGEAKGVVFNRLGEGVSFDGRFVAFWGAWGAETKNLTLMCTGEGNKDRAAYCAVTHPNGFGVAVPVHQGIFVHDLDTKQTRVVAKTPTDFDDFVYWNYSGMVPGLGSSDEVGEPARWRSATFVAVSGLVDGGLTDATFHVAFKARKGQVSGGAYVDPVDSIVLAQGPGSSPMLTAVYTGMNGTLIDEAAVDPLTGSYLPVTEIGLERDGFRGGWLAINVSMGTEAAGWAGIYLTSVRQDQ